MSNSKARLLALLLFLILGLVVLMCTMNIWLGLFGAVATVGMLFYSTYLQNKQLEEDDKERLNLK